MGLAACSKSIEPANSGIYKAEDITLTLKHLGEGKYEGSLKRADTEFPVTGTFSGNAFKGSFTSEGRPFEMTAELSADTLTVETGGETFTLKKTGDLPPEK